MAHRRSFFPKDSGCGNVVWMNEWISEGVGSLLLLIFRFKSNPIFLSWFQALPVRSTFDCYRQTTNRQLITAVTNHTISLGLNCRITPVYALMEGEEISTVEIHWEFQGGQSPRDSERENDCILIDSNKMDLIGYKYKYIHMYYCCRYNKAQ